MCIRDSPGPGRHLAVHHEALAVQLVEVLPRGPGRHQHRIGDEDARGVGVFKTHADAPRVLISNSMLVPAWATWEHFYELDRKGLMMYGQMTAGSWTVSYTHLTLPTSDL